MTWRPSEDNHWWRPRGAEYFDTSCLLPADILLFAPRRPALTQKGIRLWQERFQQFHPDHSRFTHAALYVGYDHLLCESLAKRGVVYSSLENALRGSVVRVRRFQGLTAEQRHRVLQAGAAALGTVYGWEEAIHEVAGIGKLSRKSQWGLICSRLCERALLSALMDDEGVENWRLSFHAGDHEWVTPAALSATQNLIDIVPALSVAPVPPLLQARRAS